MDRSGRLKSGDGPHLTGDAAIRDPAAALLLAPLQVAGPAAPARGLALPQTQRPPASEVALLKYQLDWLESWPSTLRVSLSRV